jgi:hypothetical protein
MNTNCEVKKKCIGTAEMIKNNIIRIEIENGYGLKIT